MCFLICNEHWMTNSRLFFVLISCTIHYCYYRFCVTRQLHRWKIFFMTRRIKLAKIERILRHLFVLKIEIKPSFALFLRKAVGIYLQFFSLTLIFLYTFNEILLFLWIFLNEHNIYWILKIIECLLYLKYYWGGLKNETINFICWFLMKILHLRISGKCISSLSVIFKSAKKRGKSSEWSDWTLF